MRSLILSGWAQPVDALGGIAPEAATFDYSDYESPKAAFEGLKQFKEVDHIIAWSLGGQLAIRAIWAGALAPAHLTLIAAPMQFVSGQGVKGMDPATDAQFRSNYAANPTRTKARFHALVAKGDSRADEVMKQLQHHPDVENTARWLPWLDALSAYSLVCNDVGLVPPTLIVHGINDAIVPASQSELLGKMLPMAQVNLWDDTAHAPHLHDAARLRAEISAHRAARVAA